MEWLEIGTFSSLLSHTRFLLTLRSKEGKYHSLILFRLSPESDDPTNARDGKPPGEEGEAREAVVKQMYVMEANCPHLGADLSHAEIEECETGLVAVCPWHRYDFDLRTGRSKMGLKACTYAVKLLPGLNASETNTNGHGDIVCVETPEGGSGWRLVELRPVSEEFADPPLPPLPAAVVTSSEREEKEAGPVVPLTDAPKTLIQWAVLILNTADPILKVQRTRHAVNLFRIGQLTSIGHKSTKAPKPPDVPAREGTFSRNIEDSGKARSGRRNMLHTLASLEQSAIDIAWDTMARFGPGNPDLPSAFFSDFSKVALDESKHFTLLASRLAALSTPYGSTPARASLWDSGATTVHSLRARLAIIHMVHEARGLDINPGAIERFRRAGDKESADVMEIIQTDEVTHVTAGQRWFTWCCNRDGGLDPIKTFREEVRTGWRGEIKGPFNVPDREKAGMTPGFYENLRGDMEETTTRKEDDVQGRVIEGIARLGIQYDGRK